MDKTCEIPRWQQLKKMIDHLPPEEFISSLETDDSIVLIDVRTEAEVTENALPGAIHIDYLSYDLLDRIDALDRDGKYFLYCRTGRRSTRTGVLMRNWDFKHITNMEGGIVALQHDQMKAENA